MLVLKCVRLERPVKGDCPHFIDRRLMCDLSVEGRVSFGAVHRHYLFEGQNVAINQSAPSSAQKKAEALPYDISVFEMFSVGVWALRVRIRWGRCALRTVLWRSWD